MAGELYLSVSEARMKLGHAHFNIFRKTLLGRHQNAMKKSQN
jgi:hypothetical protein